jgi:hypothetical protein
VVFLASRWVWGSAIVVSALIVSACRGSAVGSPPSWLSSASVAGCASADLYDSGSIAYVIVPRDCNPRLPMVVQLTTVETETRQITLSDFGVETSVELGAGTSRVVSIHRKGTWRQFPNGDSWDWRDGAGLLAKDGGLYLLGGWNSDTGAKNDVWFTRDLSNWTRLTAAAPWPARHGSAWLVHQDRLYVIGGDLIDDVWSSADGVNWRAEASRASFGKRYTPNAVSDGERIILYAGQYWEPYDWCAFDVVCVAVGLADVWSSGDGASWTRRVETAPWTGRGLIHGGARFKGRIYLIGGGLKMGLPGDSIPETIAEDSDIWSSADSITWTREATELGFPPRTHFAVLATESGCWIANGSVGTQSNTSSDVYFAPDCVHFASIPDPSPMGTRHASSIVEFNGSIVVLGGHRDTAGTTIWQYFPDVNPPQPRGR